MNKNFDELLNSIADLENEQKLPILLETLDWAINYHETHFEFLIRLEICKVSEPIGQYDLLFHNFFKVLDFYELHELAMQNWSYEILIGLKIVLGHLPKFPTMKADFIDELFELFKAKLLGYRYSLRPYYQYHLKYAIIRGDYLSASHYYRLWIEEKRDELSDCRACELQQEMEYLFDIGEFDKANNIAQRLLNGEEACDEVPSLTYSKLLLPYYKRHMFEEAVDLQSQGYFMIYQKPHLLLEAAEHIFFLSHIDVDKANRLHQKHLDFALLTNEPYAQFHFYLSILVMIRKLAKKGIESELIHDSFYAVTSEIAYDFDERHNNTFYHDLLKDTLLTYA